MTTMPSLSKRITEALNARQDAQQWESFIVSMLSKLELSRDELAQAEKHYKELGRHIARKLGIQENDVHVIVQGSMKTQTTISPRGRQNFDLDIVVKLTGPQFNNLTTSEEFFNHFGNSLKDVSEAAGDPEKKRRCWRLKYPKEPFYFDVTPAVPANRLITGTDLKVRDPDTVWSPSNPEEFADWFCKIADKRFPFQTVQRSMKLEAKTQVDPIPTAPVAIDDILRRTVQLMKLHRDNFYWSMPDERKELAPISVILVTLAGQAYNRLHQQQQNNFRSAVEVVLEVVDRLEDGLISDGGIVKVPNPMLPIENFADRWNKDNGARALEFRRWHERLRSDLEALFSEEYDKKTETRVKNVFGQIAVDSWKASLPAQTPLQGLLASLPATKGGNPTSPTPVGSKKTFG